MISDILSDAVWSMADYLAAEPKCYEEIETEIRALMLEMTKTRIVLDTPPAAVSGITNT